MIPDGFLLCLLMAVVFALLTSVKSKPNKELLDLAEQLRERKLSELARKAMHEDKRTMQCALAHLANELEKKGL